MGNRGAEESHLMPYDLNMAHDLCVHVFASVCDQ